MSQPQHQTPDRPQPNRTRHPRLPPAEARLAVGVGVLLAVACWALQAYGDPQLKAAGYAGWVAAVMVCSAAGSFVFHALHSQAQANRSMATEAWTLARRLVMRLGLAFSGAMVLFNACFAA